MVIHVDHMDIQGSKNKDNDTHTSTIDKRNGGPIITGMAFPLRAQMIDVRIVRDLQTGTTDQIDTNNNNNGVNGMEDSRLSFKTSIIKEIIFLNM